MFFGYTYIRIQHVFEQIKICPDMFIVEMYTIFNLYARKCSDSFYLLFQVIRMHQEVIL